MDTNLSTLFSDNKVIIVLLIILSIFAILGANYLIDIVGKLINIVLEIASMFVYITGNLINTLTGAVAVTAKGGIDVAETTIKNAGDILIKTGEPKYDELKNNLDSLFSYSESDISSEGFEQGLASDIVQYPISIKKRGWYLNQAESKQNFVHTNSYGKPPSNQPFPHNMKILQ